MESKEFGPKTKEEIILELKNILSNYHKADSMEQLEQRTDKIVDFAEEFQLNHPDYLEMELFHVLAGSTPDHELTKWDTENSEIENFIRSLA